MIMNSLANSSHEKEGTLGAKSIMENLGCGIATLPGIGKLFGVDLSGQNGIADRLLNTRTQSSPQDFRTPNRGPKNS